MIRPTLLALALAASLSACAAETSSADAKKASATPATTDVASRERIEAALQTLAPGMKVDSVAPSPIPGFVEVAVGARVFYVSEDASQLLQGSLVDIASQKSLTQASEAKLRAGMLREVGDDTGIAFPAAQPKHEVTVFTDIDCGYCRRMHSEIAEYNRLGISVNYLFYPRAGIGSESYQKAVNVWCAPDRRKALTQAKAGRDLPEGNCTSPVTQDFELGRRIGLDGTPAIYAADGTQLGGYVPPAEMLARLEEIAAKPGK
ncbi:MAG TPA: DsbC family protein [Arenimonas sp.]|nr:DsbC family protein [Arenimonas sp.]